MKCEHEEARTKGFVGLIGDSQMFIQCPLCKAWLDPDTYTPVDVLPTLAVWKEQK